jgi:catechol 2,3-dioxygenase-like lactoylglutathione lyase family enzyme
MVTLDLRGLTPLLQVYDMPRSIHFYCDLLGFEVVSTSPKLKNGYFHWAWLRLGEAELMLNTAYEFDEERPERIAAERTAGHNDVGLFISCPDVDAAYEELRAKGVAAGKPKVAPYGMKQMNVRDPDGYGLCFQWPVET